MALRLPSEIVAEEFVPTVRAMLAVELDERGLTQQAIADRLGITQAAVSNHLDGQVAVAEPIAEHPQTVATVERIADGFDRGDLSEVDALADLLALVETLEDRGPICELHEAAMPSLSGLGCDLCVRGPDEDRAAERAALADVRDAARRLAATPSMASLVPKVGTNLATGVPGATDVTDVAAVPGRLIRMRGSIELPADPEFGASEHVAGTVLAATSVDPDVRGAVNLALDDDLLDAARVAGHELLEFDAEYEDRTERLRTLFAERGSVPAVCYHRGAFGIEPICYVLAETATDAVDLAIELAGARDAD